MAWQDTVNEFHEDGMEMTMPPIQPADPEVGFETDPKVDVDATLPNTELGSRIQAASEMTRHVGQDMAPQMSVTVPPPQPAGLGELAGPANDATAEMHARLEDTGPAATANVPPPEPPQQTPFINGL